MVQVEGRINYAGVAVSVPGVPGANAVSASNGAYTIFDVPVGTHTVIAKISRYLYSQKSDVVVNAGFTTTLPDVNLHGGDANDDNVVDIFDLVIIGLAYNSTPGDPDWDPRADINADNAVNLWDLVLVGTNYNGTAPTEWSILSSSKDRIKLQPPKASLVAVEAGSDLVVELKVNEAVELYGAELEMSFDPSVLAVRDADLSRAGVQIENGEMFSAEESFVVQNSVDNAKGIVRYAVTLLRPAQPVSGDGVIVRIRFRAQSDKKTIISLRKLGLYSKANESVQLVSGVRLLVKAPRLPKEPLPPLLKGLER